MIGIKFLLMFLKVTASVVVGLGLALLFLFVVSYALRFFFEGFRWGVHDHWKWFRGLFVWSRKEAREWKVQDMQSGEIFYVSSPGLIQYFQKERPGRYTVLSGPELKKD